MNKKWLTALFLVIGSITFIFAGVIYTQHKNQNIAEAGSFTYNNKPIDPFCVWSYDPKQEKALADCISNNPAIDSSGIVEATRFISYPDDKQVAAYKILFAKENIFILATYSYGGGVHTYLDLKRVRMGPKMLNIEEISSQSNTNFECNGLIRVKPWDLNSKTFETDANNVYFSEHLGPLSFINLIPGNIRDTDLANDTTNCAGVARFAYDFIEQKKNLISVDLNKEGVGEPQYEGNYKYQACFNTIYNQYINSGKIKLNLDQVKEFSDTFKSSCLLR